MLEVYSFLQFWTIVDTIRVINTYFETYLAWDSTVARV